MSRFGRESWQTGSVLFGLKMGMCVYCATRKTGGVNANIWKAVNTYAYARNVKSRSVSLVKGIAELPAANAREGTEQ